MIFRIKRDVSDSGPWALPGGSTWTVNDGSLSPDYYFRVADPLFPALLEAEALSDLDGRRLLIGQKTPNTPLPDVLRFEVPEFVCSRRLTDIIETLEPDTHQIIPLTVVDRTDHSPFGTYDYINVVQTAPCLDVDASSHAQRKVRKWDGVPWVSLSALTPGGQIVKESAAIGLHLWRDAEARGAFFCSEALKSRLEKARVTGFSFLAAQPALNLH
ncbi:MAG: DUF1629 domain-containing protein [Pseudomonadota bacterium]